MKRLFGTDGVRGVVGEKITPKLAFDLGFALAVFKKRELDVFYNITYTPTVIIGQDTRKSSDALTASFASGVSAGGGNAVIIGVAPTPCVAYLTKSKSADYGVMISASHNPPQYNGIKFFSSNGLKFSDSQEELFEDFFYKSAADEKKGEVPFSEMGKISFDGKLIDEYFNHILGVSAERLDGLKIVLDCAYGAAALLAARVFKALGAAVKALNDEYRGELINAECGAVNISKLAKTVSEEGYDIGFAFDGDADRMIAVLLNGQVLDGDRIILLLANMLKKKNKLNKNVVVGTLVSNLGLEAALKKQDIELKRTDVGDKYIAEEMFKNNYALGGEQSGHTIIAEYSGTGDGILTASLVARFLKHNPKTFNKTMKDLKLLPQITTNINIADYEIINHKTLTEEIEKALEYLGAKDNKRAKVLIRRSGTENLLRVMVEGESYEKVSFVSNRLKNVIMQLDKN
jgi:phosphoglucosamine mutase